MVRIQFASSGSHSVMVRIQQFAVRSHVVHKQFDKLSNVVRCTFGFMLLRKPASNSLDSGMAVNVKNPASSRPQKDGIEQLRKKMAACGDVQEIYLSCAFKLKDNKCEAVESYLRLCSNPSSSDKRSKKVVPAH
jgi:hypothetical protein